jgi:hypothetical protein
LIGTKPRAVRDQMGEGRVGLVWVREDPGPQVVHRRKPVALTRFYVDELEVDQAK